MKIEKKKENQEAYLQRYQNGITSAKDGIL